MVFSFCFIPISSMLFPGKRMPFCFRFTPPWAACRFIFCCSLLAIFLQTVYNAM